MSEKARPKQIDPELRKVRARVNKLPDEYLQCRTLMHAWRMEFWGDVSQIPREEVPPVAAAYRWSMVRVLTCSRCGTIRHDFYRRGSIDPMELFRVAFRRYTYADGYGLPGTYGIDRREFTRAAFNREA